MSTVGLARTSRRTLSSDSRVNGDRTLHKGEWFLATESEPPAGAHVVTQRRGYTHHGIYVGAGQIVHYAGLARGLRRGPVEKTSLSRFAAGHAIGVIARAPQKFDAREVVRRARSRLGEDNYRLLTNNCEHFCEWCLQGERRSYQIEACLGLPSRALHVTWRLMIASAECASAIGKGVVALMAALAIMRIGRPRQLYTGPIKRDYLPTERRLA